MKKVRAWLVLGPKGGIIKVRQLKKIAEADAELANCVSTAGFYQKVVPCIISYKDGISR